MSVYSRGASTEQFVIAGIPRCGTTLLASLLNAQDGCTFLAAYITAFEQVADAMGIAWNEPLDLDQRRRALLLVREGMLRVHHAVLLGSQEFGTLVELHTRVMHNLATPGDRIVGYKAVLNAAKVRRLLQQTNVRCIIVYRDPRDAALSWHGYRGAGVERYLESWRDLVAVVRRPPSPHLIAVRYEDIVRPPHKGLVRLGREIGLEIQEVRPQRLLVGGRAVPWPGNSSRVDVQRTLDARSVGRWRNESGSEVVRYAEWLCRSEIVALGYAASETGLRLGEHARFALRREATRLEDALTDGAKWMSQRLIQRISPPLRAARR